MGDGKVMRFGQDPRGIPPLLWWFQIAIGQGSFKLLKFLSPLPLTHMKYWICPRSTTTQRETTIILICSFSSTEFYKVKSYKAKVSNLISRIMMLQSTHLFPIEGSISISKHTSVKSLVTLKVNIFIFCKFNAS